MSNKFGAIKTEVDGFVFDSKREARVYSELKLLEKAGELTDLELQPVFRVQVNEKHICDYISDFRYYDVKSREVIVVDVKSKATRTPVYRLKKKLVEAIYGIKITEVT